MKTTMLRNMLRDGIDHAVAECNDFINLALTGELLRRAACLDELRFDELARYDAFLASYAGPLPWPVSEDLDAALARLQAFCCLRPANQEPDSDLLTAVDDVLSVAAACVRTGRVDARELVWLHDVARSRVDVLAARLSRLWEAASDVSTAGPDPDFPDLYDWIEPLAELSEASYAVRLALRSDRPSL